MLTGFFFGVQSCIRPSFINRTQNLGCKGTAGQLNIQNILSTDSTEVILKRQPTEPGGVKMNIEKGAQYHVTLCDMLP
jgi:hypothetical protein